MPEINKDEEQIYDRQIRLWGHDAQNRLRNSSVLIAGLGGLGAEVTKNLMLSGVKSLTLMDDKKVTEDDYYSQFFIPRETKLENRAEASKERVQVLNPMVQVNVLAESVDSKPDEFFTRFDLVILLDQPYETVNRVNKICRQHKIRFQAGSVFGVVGYAFLDFNGHTFLLPKPKETGPSLATLDDDDDDGPATKKLRPDNGNGVIPLHQICTIDDDEKIKRPVSFPSFEHSLSVDLNTKRFIRRRFNKPSAYFVIRAIFHLSKTKEAFTVEELVEQWKDELQQAGLEESSQSISAADFELFFGPAMNPVCAIVGSLIGQEAIKAISQNDVPLKNLFLYSAVDTTGIIFDLST